MSRPANRLGAVLVLLVLLLAGALFSGGCCGLKTHHQRRLGPDTSRLSYQEDTDLFSALNRKILRFGAPEGAPAVLLLHEIGGATPEALELGERLKKEGYTVYVPVLFGGIGERHPNLLARCRSHDFRCLSNSASPLAHELLDKLLPRLAARHPAIGVIGMCLTGNFPLLLVQHGSVKAAVVSQPALPLLRKSVIGLSDQELRATKAALDSKKTRVLYFRYSLDCVSPGERLEALSKALPGRVDRRVFPACDSEHHAVLTDSLTETPEAWQCLTTYLAETLQGKAPTPGSCVSQEELDRLDRATRCGQGG